MQRPSGPGTTPNGEFTAGNPGTGTPATVLTAEYMNSDLREKIAILAAAGKTPDPNNDAQLLESIQFLIAAAGGGGGVSGGRNLLINGAFDLIQRGPGSSGSNFAITNAQVYTFDRWKTSADSPGSGTGAATLSQQEFVAGQTDVPGEPRYFLRWVQTAAASAGQPRLEQRVESVRQFGTGKVVLSVWLKASAALAGTLRLTQVFGQGGSPSAPVVIGTQAISMTTAWQRFSLLVDIGAGGFSLTGKTFGTDDDYLRVEVLLPQGATFTIDVADCQLEKGAAVSAFARRDRRDELELAQRYYETSRRWANDYLAADSTVNAHAANDGGGNVFGLSTQFKITKRKTPTMLWINPSTQALNGIQWGGARTVTATNGQGPKQTGYPVCSSGPTVGTLTAASAHWDADAEL